MSRDVTERDLRMPEFRDANVDDLEFRDDGKLVRKDRWETGFRSVAYVIGFNRRSGFEIQAVVDKVTELVEGLEQAVGDDIWHWLKPPVKAKTKTEES